MLFTLKETEFIDGETRLIQRRIELNDASVLLGYGKELLEMVRPPRIELGFRVPETLVISFSLRAR